MKKILLILLSATATLALAQTSTYQLLNNIYSSLEDGRYHELSEQQKDEVKDKLSAALNIINGGSSTPSLLCTVSSNHSAYFRIHNGQVEIGGDMNRSTCKKLKKQTNRGLVCATSLNHSAYYGVYNTKTAEMIGGDTTKGKCLKMVEAATNIYTCAVSTNHSAYYSIYNKNTGARLGGDTTLRNCLEELENL